MDDSEEIFQEVLDFCHRNNILAPLATAMGLLEEYFGQSDVMIRIHDGKILLEVLAEEDDEEALDNYSDYLQQWVSMIPWPERDRIHLQLVAKF